MKTLDASPEHEPGIGRDSTHQVADGALSDAAELGDLGLGHAGRHDVGDELRPVRCLIDRHADIVEIGDPMCNIGRLMAMPSPRERTPFGLRLNQARKRAGLLQSDVAEKLGISQGTLSGLEKTGRSSGLVVQLATLYRCSPVWLATGEGDPMFDGAAAVPGPVSAKPATVPKRRQTDNDLEWESVWSIVAQLRHLSPDKRAYLLRECERLQAGGRPLSPDVMGLAISAEFLEHGNPDRAALLAVAEDIVNSGSRREMNLRIEVHAARIKGGPKTGPIRTQPAEPSIAPASPASASRPRARPR